MTDPRTWWSRARSVAGKARRIPPADWPLVAQTLAVAAVVEVGLRTARLPALARLLGTPLVDAPPDLHHPDFAEVIAHLPVDARRRLRIAAQLVRRWPFDEKCLRRSLVAGFSIRKWHPNLVIGVAIVEGEVSAHAWLIVDGLSLDPWGSALYASLKKVPE